MPWSGCTADLLVGPLAELVVTAGAGLDALRLRAVLEREHGQEEDEGSEARSGGVDDPLAWHHAATSSTSLVRPAFAHGRHLPPDLSPLFVQPQITHWPGIPSGTAVGSSM